MLFHIKNTKTIGKNRYTCYNYTVHFGCAGIAMAGICRHTLQLGFGKDGKHENT